MQNVLKVDFQDILQIKLGYLVIKIFWLYSRAVSYLSFLNFFLSKRWKLQNCYYFVWHVVSAKGDYVGELNCSSGYRQGWGEMRWANGTFYGPGNIFIYSQGDRYFGQWIQNKQEGE